jgi:glycosyltransferase involved in cell wall biosynthesis
VKKALVIAPQPFFSPRGTPFSVYYRTSVMARQGVSIDFLTYGEGQDVDIDGVRIIRIPRFATLGNVKIGPSALKLFLDIFILLWAVRLLRKNRYDFVHAHEEAVFICRLLKPFFNFRMIYDMHSSLPQQLTNFQFSRSRTLLRTFEWLENSCLRAAEAVVTICPELHDYVNGIIEDQQKHILIENCLFDEVKLKNTAPGPVTATSAIPQAAGELPVGKRFVVYTGTLEAYQGMDILVEAFKHVSAEIPDAFLLVIGGNRDQVTRYRGLSASFGIQEKCFFTGRVPQAEAKYYLGIASVLVSPRSEGTNTPLKIYEYLASGIPIVATDIQSHTQILDDDVSFLVKPDGPSMARGIIASLEDKERRNRTIANARRLFEEKYSRAVYESKIRRLMELIG